jgi:GMP synthase (glutamine-hydrolysing)
MLFRNKGDERMICFVDIEHEKALQEPQKRQAHYAGRVEIQHKLEEASGTACLVQRYPDVTRERLAEWGIQALLISGNASDWVDYDEGELDEMCRIIRTTELPVLGFCGGLQLIALAYETPLGAMRRLKEGESDGFSEYQPVFFKERGFMPVNILRADTIFSGLGETPVLFESHYFEVKEVPPDFELLASTGECRVQAIKHRTRPVYATQFHPELYDEAHTDGRTVLRNFFQLVGIRKGHPVPEDVRVG